MASLMLINPRRRKSRTRSRVRAKSVRRRVRRAARHLAVGYTISNRKIRRRKLNPSRRHHHHAMRHHRRLHRNPSGGKLRPMQFTKETLMPSLIGGVGAVGLDMAMGFLAPKLPVSLQTGPAQTLVKLLGAIALGLGVGMATSRKTGEMVAVGGITVVLYDAVKGFVSTQFPTMPMAGLGYTGPGLIQHDMTGMGAYLTGPESMTYGNMSNQVPNVAGLSGLDGMDAYVTGGDY